MNKNILITGGPGLIGSCLARKCVNSGQSPLFSNVYISANY